MCKRAFRLGIPLGGACNKEYSIWAVETALLGNAYMALHLRPKHLVRTSAEPGMDDCLVVRLVQDLQAGDGREQAVDQLSDLAAESLHDFTQNATERARLAPVKPPWACSYTWHVTLKPACRCFRPECLSCYILSCMPPALIMASTNCAEVPFLQL